MIDYLTNYEYSLPNNIIHGPLQNISITYSKINVYNGDGNNPLQKFWFLLKNIKIVEYTEKYIKIALSNSESDKKFVQYIDQLDFKIHQMICDISGIEVDKRISYSNDKYSPVLFHLNNIANCVVFDENNKITQLTKSNICDYTMSVLIELSDIMIGDNDYWVNYTVKQLKLNPTIDCHKSIFELIDESDANKKILNIHNIPNVPNLPPPIPPEPFIVPSFQQNRPDNKSQINSGYKKNEDNQRSRIIISVDDLKNQIKKMQNKKLLKEEENMKYRLEDYRKEIEQFKDNQKFVSDKYKSIVETIL